MGEHVIEARIVVRTPVDESPSVEEQMRVFEFNLRVGLPPDIEIQVEVVAINEAPNGKSFRKENKMSEARMLAWSGTNPNNQTAPITTKEAQKFFDASRAAGAILRGGTRKRPEDHESGFILGVSMMTSSRNSGQIVSCSIGKGSERVANIATEPANGMRPFFVAANILIPEGTVFNGEAPIFKEPKVEDPGAKPPDLNQI